jgi:uncharacterized membrane protein YdfJ with MMPL/SSD domain
VKAAVEASLKRIERTDHVDSVISPFSRLGKSLMSEDRTIAAAQVLLDLNGGQTTRAIAADVMAGTESARAAGVQVEAGGVLGVRLSEVTSRRSEIIGIGVGIVILAFTFGTLVAAGMPIVIAGVGLAAGLGLVGLLGHVMDIPDLWRPPWRRCSVWASASTTRCSSSSATETSCTRAAMCARPSPARWQPRAPPWCSPASR